MRTPTASEAKELAVENDADEITARSGTLDTNALSFAGLIKGSKLIHPCSVLNGKVEANGIEGRDMPNPAPARVVQAGPRTLDDS